jgi:acetate kinase
MTAGGSTEAAIVTLNAGSSSLKYGIYAATAEPRAIARGEIEHDTAGDAETLIAEIDKRLDGRPLAAVGHRIVHGGPDFVAPVRLTDEIIAALDALTPWAPLHQPLCLAPVKKLATARPDLPQIACFDTAFHHNLRPPVSRYAIPLAYEAKGIRRYGFHGLSYEHVARRLGEISPHLKARKTIVAHLGSGASLCAMQDGASVDTTMGFSVLDGLVMASRPGAIDPGILLYLLKEEGLTPQQLEDLLYHKSGLLGVSGLSGDMRELLASAAPDAREAIELYTFRIAREIAALTNSLDGLDLLVFTGGVGEHAAPIRAMVASRLRWLGLEIDAAANAAAAERIDVPQSAVEVRIIPADEELAIARHVMAVLGQGLSR